MSCASIIRLYDFVMLPFLLNITFKEIIDDFKLHFAILLSNYYLKLETLIMHNKFYSVYLIDSSFFEVILIIYYCSNFSSLMLKSVQT
jgi:hypothetical protein